MTIMVMPMAGEGKRTAKFSNKPKPLIEINGYPMFYWAAKNITTKKKIFIVRKEHVDQYKIDQTIKHFFPDSIVLIQENKLNGQLLSVLVAEKYLTSSEDLFIVDCDMYSDFNINDFFKNDDDGSILVFNSNSPNYSYIELKNKYIKSIIEKTVVSNNAVAGIFYWKNSNDFLNNAKLCIKNNLTINNEYYVSTTYSMAINNNLKISAIKSNNTYDLSTETGIKDFTKILL